MERFKNLVELIVKNGELKDIKSENGVVFGYQFIYDADSIKFEYEYYKHRVNMYMYSSPDSLHVTYIHPQDNIDTINLAIRYIENNIKIRGNNRILMKDTYCKLERIIKENGGEIEGKKYFITYTDNTISVVDKDGYDLYHFVKDRFFKDDLEYLKQALEITKETLMEEK